MILSEQEQFLINVLREAKPFERVEITKDPSGKPDRYLVHRSQKIVVSEISIGAIK